MSLFLLFVTEKTTYELHRLINPRGFLSGKENNERETAELHL